MAERTEELRRRLHALGFDEVRFARVAPAPEGGPTPESGRSLREWLAEGMQAGMAWMERTAEKRLHPDRVLPGAQSVVMLGVNYWPGGHDGPGAGCSAPVWARYALYEDYHDTMKPALVAAGRVIEEMFGADGADYRYYVDTGPVLERGWAERAGIGFLGKNGMLISRQYGNWLLLAAILTKVALAEDAPLRKSTSRPPGMAEPAATIAAPGERIGLLCGKCTRCLDACPTRAFPRPGVVDSRRCISYQTIENRGVIPRELRAGIGLRLYGCDVCLEVCPWNRFAQTGRRMLLASRHDLAALNLPEILALTPARFATVFRRTGVKRLRLAGLLRNACVVAGNTGDSGLLPPLVALASHESALVRTHAVWAVGRLAERSQARALLRDARAQEADAAVLAEYAEEERTIPSISRTAALGEGRVKIPGASPGVFDQTASNFSAQRAYNHTTGSAIQAGASSGELDPKGLKIKE
jgi:epoxyqueuosine reductase